MALLSNKEFKPGFNIQVEARLENWLYLLRPFAHLLGKEKEFKRYLLKLRVRDLWEEFIEKYAMPLEISQICIEPLPEEVEEGEESHFVIKVSLHLTTTANVEVMEEFLEEKLIESKEGGYLRISYFPDEEEFLLISEILNEDLNLYQV